MWLRPAFLRLIRWGLAGGGSLLLQLVIQAALVTVLGFPAHPGIVLAYELALVAHFLVNDRWVFGQARPSWRRLVEFHGSALAAEAVTLAVAFVVLSGPAVTLLGPTVAPFAATIAGTAAATALTFSASFFWIWRPRPAV